MFTRSAGLHDWRPCAETSARRRGSASKQLPWRPYCCIQFNLDILRGNIIETPWRRALCLATPQYALYKRRFRLGPPIVTCGQCLPMSASGWASPPDTCLCKSMHSDSLLTKTFRATADQGTAVTGPTPAPRRPDRPRRQASRHRRSVANTTSASATTIRDT